MKVKHAISALYQLASEHDVLNDVLKSFEVMQQQLSESVISYLDSPTVDIQLKCDVLNEMEIDSYTNGFFHTLIKRREVHQFEDIYQGMLSYMRELNKVYIIDVYVANALSNQHKTALEKQLIHYFQASKVILKEHLDKDVIGGLKIMYQKQSLDQTVIQQFHQMEMMI